jgi:antitoxin component YwqK of YwqJK toxin-antitoxin module
MRLLLNLIFATLLLNLQIIDQNIGQVGDSIINYTDINGMKQGNWITKYSNGKTKYEGFFKNNKPTGKFVRYYDTGNIQSVAYFYDNSKYSSIKFYDNAERLLAAGRYKEQNKDSIWNYYLPEGKLISVEEYDNGKLNGTSKTFFYPSGLLHETINYKDNIKDGLYEKLWNDGVTPRLRVRYCNGMVCDTMFVYFESGKIESTIPYKDDKRHGLEMNYNEKGTRISVVPYKDGICLDPEKEKRETQEIQKLLNNKGRYMEPFQFDDPVDFLRKNQERDNTKY